MEERKFLRHIYAVVKYEKALRRYASFFLIDKSRAGQVITLLMEDAVTEKIRHADPELKNILMKKTRFYCMQYNWLKVQLRTFMPKVPINPN
jgi:hypothetical protein